MTIVSRFGDFFTNTGGVSMTITGNKPVISRAQELFQRDWTSQYAVPIPYPDPVTRTIPVPAFV